ncbi:hypothetical protein GGX14DRAFT_393635 [Mycena pura]|uniref:Uncharacterized protein n=1 Tax=Mycena pura TaxID=153505 RepID=A0AAD6YCN6_9AGAR|nr:hypothetical protein GGX14DRAFT_393635 [Mycena pura]
MNGGRTEEYYQFRTIYEYEEKVLRVCAGGGGGGGGGVGRAVDKKRSRPKAEVLWRKAPHECPRVFDTFCNDGPVEPKILSRTKKFEPNGEDLRELCPVQFLFKLGHTLWLNWAVTSWVPAGFNPYGFLKPVTKIKFSALQRYHYGKCQKPMDTHAELYQRRSDQPIRKGNRGPQIEASRNQSAGSGTARWVEQISTTDSSMLISALPSRLVTVCL